MHASCAEVQITAAYVFAGEHTITAQTPVLPAPADAVATLSEVSTQQLHKHQGMPTRITVFLASQPGSMAGTDGAAGECALQGFKVEYVQASIAHGDSNCSAAAVTRGNQCMYAVGQERRKVGQTVVTEHPHAAPENTLWSRPKTHCGRHCVHGCHVQGAAAIGPAGASQAKVVLGTGLKKDSVVAVLFQKQGR